jgi:hypothetical protein
MMEIIHNILAFDFKSIDDRIVSVISHTYYIKQKKDITESLRLQPDVQEVLPLSPTLADCIKHS